MYFLIILRPPRSTRTDTLCPYTTLFRSRGVLPSGAAGNSLPTMTKAARKPLISGNWKMHHNHFEALQLVQKLSYLITPEDHDACEVSVHPPFTDLPTVQTYFMSEKDRKSVE